MDRVVVKAAIIKGTIKSAYGEGKNKGLRSEFSLKSYARTTLFYIYTVPKVFNKIASKEERGKVLALCKLYKIANTFLKG